MLNLLSAELVDFYIGRYTAVAVTTALILNNALLSAGSSIYVFNITILKHTSIKPTTHYLVRYRVEFDRDVPLFDHLHGNGMFVDDVAVADASRVKEDGVNKIPVYSRSLPI